MSTVASVTSSTLTTPTQKSFRKVSSCPGSSQSQTYSIATPGSPHQSVVNRDGVAFIVKNDSQLLHRTLTMPLTQKASEIQFLSNPIQFQLLNAAEIELALVKSGPNQTEYINTSVSLDQPSPLRSPVAPPSNGTAASASDKATSSQASGDACVPLALMWLRVSDLADHLRRRDQKRKDNSGWVRASQVDGDIQSRDQPIEQSSKEEVYTSRESESQGEHSGVVESPNDDPRPSSEHIKEWFALEPAGAVLLSLNFVKSNRKRLTGSDRTSINKANLRRKGAFRKRPNHTVVANGHQFVQKQNYGIVVCAACNDFILNGIAYKCKECRYLCHIKCSSKAITKCIAESDQGDFDINLIRHRIPHAFEPFSNLGASWCCHCGYTLPIGRKQSRKCTECATTCHLGCAHLVPDFCGMSNDRANQLIASLRSINGQRSPEMHQAPLGSDPVTRMPTHKHAQFSYKRNSVAQQNLDVMPKPYQAGLHISVAIQETSEHPQAAQLTTEQSIPQEADAYAAKMVCLALNRMS